MAVIEYRHQERTGSLSGYGPESTPVAVRLVTFDRTQRLRRAGLGLATWWSVALATAFVPVAHFALVPGFLGFGVWSAVRRSRTAVVALSATGACPDCRTEQDFDVSGPWADTRPLACGHCRRTLRLTMDRADAPPA